MPAIDVALTARARGVGTHLVSRETLESLADAVDVPAVARGLARAGARFEPFGEAPDIEAFERSVRRTASVHLQTLLRWQRGGPGPLDVVLADQDRRNLRALLRGAVQGAPAATRLAGLMPTPTLPERALSELARLASPSAVVAHLIVLRHPDAYRLQPIVRDVHPNLLAIDIALLNGFAARAGAAARAGDDAVRDVVQERIDVGNAQDTLLLAGGHDAIDVEAFVDGGRWLSRSVFAAAAAAHSPQECLTVLALELSSTPLAPVLPRVVAEAAHMDRAWLASMLSRLARRARLEPLGGSTLLVVLLRLEAQSRDLRALGWGARLGTPPVMRKQALVTPWH